MTTSSTRRSTPMRSGAKPIRLRATPIRSTQTWPEDEFRSVPHEAGHEPLETIEPDEPFESEFASPPMIDDRSPRLEPRHDEFTEEENGDATDVEPANEATEVTEVTEVVEASDTEEAAEPADKPAKKPRAPRAGRRAPRRSNAAASRRAPNRRTTRRTRAPSRWSRPSIAPTTTRRSTAVRPADDLDELLSFSMARPEDADSRSRKKHAQPAYDEFDQELDAREVRRARPIDDLVDEEIVSVDELTHLSYDSAPIPSDADIDAAIEAGRIDDEPIETDRPRRGARIVDDLGEDEIERVQIVELDTPAASNRRRKTSIPPSTSSRAATIATARRSRPSRGPRPARRSRRPRARRSRRPRRSRRSGAVAIVAAATTAAVGIAVAAAPAGPAGAIGVPAGPRSGPGRQPTRIQPAEAADPGHLPPRPGSARPGHQGRHRHQGPDAVAPTSASPAATSS